MARMKNNCRRIFSALLLLLFVFVSAGCGKTLVPVYEQKIFYEENRPKEGTEPPPLYENARLYLDNTYGMYGRVLAHSDEKSGYVRVVTRVLDFMNNKFRDQSYSVLQGIEGSKASKWVPLENRDDILGFTKEEFYIKDHNLIDPISSGDLRIGEALNIYITDLTESTSQNKLFAEALNRAILSDDGTDYSALLYFFSAKYEGLFTVRDDTNIGPDGNPLEKHDYRVVDDAPFYMFVLGKTAEVREFLAAFDPDMGDTGRFEVSEFYAHRGLSSGAVSFRTEEFALTKEMLADDPLEDAYTFENTALNFDTVRVNGNEVFTEVRETLPGLYFKTTDALSANLSGDEQYEQRFTFAAELPKLATDKNVAYTLTLDKVYYAAAEDREGPAEDGDQTVRSRFNAEPMDDGQLFALCSPDNNQRLLDIVDPLTGSSILDKDAPIVPHKDSVTLRRIPQEAIDDLSERKKEGLAPDFRFEKGSAGGGYYLITVATHSKADAEALYANYDGLIFCFRITAVADVDTGVPEWVEKHNRASAEIRTGAGRSEKEQEFIDVCCVDDLDYIYAYLNGTMENGEQRRANEEAMETEIAAFTVMLDLTEIKTINGDTDYEEPDE